MTIAKEFEHNGKTVRIFYEEDTEFANPRDADNLGIMLADGHRNYTLGDEDYQHGLLGEYEMAQRTLHELADEGKMREFPNWLQEYLGTTVLLALGLIDHSGISMYTVGGNLIADPEDRTDTSHPFDPGGWDSGLIGFIFDTAKRREATGVPEDRIEEALRIEVKEYDKYLTGDVYGYEILNEDGEEEDSCGGFLGLEYAVQSARDAAGYTCKHCQRQIVQHIGPVIDDQPEGDEHGFVHQVCRTCDRAAAWGGDGFYHVDVKPWDWPGGKPDHEADAVWAHRCPGLNTFGETDQEVGSYS